MATVIDDTISPEFQIYKMHKFYELAIVMDKAYHEGSLPDDVAQAWLDIGFNGPLRIKEIDLGPEGE